MQNDKPCRHEYVKIFQRKYKGLGRRLISTKGYLPVGFSIKDFSHLSDGSFCFCATCRMRLFPARIDANKLQKNAESKQAESQVSILPIAIDESNIDLTDNKDTSQVVNVEELQIESLDVSDLADKKVIVSGEDDPEEEEGEE